jgi:DDE family transposase
VCSGFWEPGHSGARCEKYPPYQTCHRHFQQWVRTGKLEDALKQMARHLHERGQLNLEEAFVDATFALGPTRRRKGTKIIAIAADNSLPLALSVDSASPAECKLVEYVLAGSFLDHLPVRLIGDKAYDSDPLDRRLHEEYGIEMIAPNRRNRSRSQDGRKLRRYCSAGESRGLCMAAQLPPPCHPMGTSHREFPRLRPPCLPPHTDQAFIIRIFNL